MEDAIGEFVLNCLVGPFVKEISTSLARRGIDSFTRRQASVNTNPVLFASQTRSERIITEHVSVLNGWLYVYSNPIPWSMVPATMNGDIWCDLPLPPNSTPFGHVYRLANGTFYLTNGRDTWKLPDKPRWSKFIATGR